MTNPQSLSSAGTVSNDTLSISASFLRLLLETSKAHLTPRFYQKFLQEAGLERFATELPKTELVPTASFNEVATFMGKIYTVTQDGVYPLFSQNLGMGIAKNFITQPQWLEMKAKAEQAFKDKNLSPERKLALLASLKNTLPRNGVQWQTEGLTLIAKSTRCFYCYTVKTDKPICHARKVYLSAALTWLTGWHFSGEQYQSMARGDAACAYRFTPLNVDELR